MDRQLITGKNNEFNIEDKLTSKYFVIDCDKLPLYILININEEINANILVINLKDNNELNFNLSAHSSLKLSILAKNELKELKINANLQEYAEFNGYFADFIVGNNNSNVQINLLGEESSCAWHLASLATANDQKIFDVSVVHLAKNSYCRLDNYGVCLGQSQLTFKGVCHIKENCAGSKAHQNARIMVFDEACKGQAKPILKIDENDIEASHAAVVGKINDDHLFYLTSRGLSLSAAKELITLGYLKPILHGFDDEIMKEEINNLIVERM